MESLPFYATFYGADGAWHLPEGAQWPPAPLRHCPGSLLDFIAQSLKFCPKERWSAATARQHAFVSAKPLDVIIKCGVGEKGLGTIAEGCCEEELLDYLQKCPGLAKIIKEARNSRFAAKSRGVSKAEAAKHLKVELVTLADEKVIPKTVRLNGDVMKSGIASQRLQYLVRALRRKLRPWLQQLTVSVREQLRREGLPQSYLGTNGDVFLEEDFADNAFVYASVQILKVAQRAEDWHTDGGASLLHFGITIFGSRVLQIQVDGDCISRLQQPGSFYVGTLCALRHRVEHGATSAGAYREGVPKEEVQVAVMLRCDVFRQTRARKINATPGPTELFTIVNAACARFLAEHPVHLPNLADVLAEAEREGDNLCV